MDAPAAVSDWCGPSAPCRLRSQSCPWTEVPARTATTFARLCCVIYVVANGSGNSVHFWPKRRSSTWQSMPAANQCHNCGSICNIGIAHARGLFGALHVGLRRVLGAKSPQVGMRPSATGLLRVEGIGMPCCCASSSSGRGKRCTRAVKLPATWGSWPGCKRNLRRRIPGIASRWSDNRYGAISYSTVGQWKASHFALAAQGRKRGGAVLGGGS